MTINGEALDTLGTGVDQTETMNLTRSELELGHTGISGTGSLVTGGDGGAVKVHLAIDEVVVRSHGSPVARGQGLLHKIEVLGVVPVRQHHRTKIDVVGDVLGSVDDNGAEYAV